MKDRKPIIPRGIRNNNPLNIRRNPNSLWLGEVKSLRGQTDKSFCQFESLAYGYRAAAKCLLTYQSKYGLSTLGEIISRWAPRNENDTNAYIRRVASRLSASQGRSITGDTALHLATSRALLSQLIASMHLVENGQATTMTEHRAIEQALDLLSL